MVNPQTSHGVVRRVVRRRIAGVCLLAATAFSVALPVRAVAATVDDGASQVIIPVEWGDGWDPGSPDNHAWGGGGSGGGGSAGGQQTATVDSDPATKAESKGVVLIDTVVAGGQAAGTGMVLTSKGEVLTNYHVVEGATTINITVATTGKTYAATVLGSDQSADVALLQLTNASGLDTVAIDDDSVAAGDQVTAVGNAGGTGSLTAADGTVTALKASITTASEGSVEGETLTSMIETDADVVPGDSGGPLLDEEGEVVGIDTAASTGSQIDGYAIPIATALKVVDQIRSGDSSGGVRVGSAGYLGVQLAADGYGNLGAGTQGSATQGWATAGAAVAGVVDGQAAAKAGLEAGDVITRVDSSSISSADELAQTIGSHDAGDTITIGWVDGSGTSHTASVTLGADPTA